jgi:pilus assembly protein CpaB
MIGSPPELATGEREIAILVDAETGVAGKISPGSIVDIVATFGADDQEGVPPESTVVVPGARIIDVGRPELKGGNGVQEQEADPTTVVPVTFALDPKEALTVTYAESFAAEVRLALLRPGEESELKKKERVYRRPSPKPSQ